MELIKKSMRVLLAVFGFFASVFGYSIDYESIESYELMPIIFKQDANIISETIFINNLKTEIEIPCRLSKILSIKDTESNSNNYITNFWQIKDENECTIEREVSENNEIVWKSTVPEETSRLEILLEENYQEIVFYPLTIQFGGISTDEYIIDKSKLFFLSKKQQETNGKNIELIH